MLWFDVGIVRYTTISAPRTATAKLWFDVGIVRYTTEGKKTKASDSCGLM